MKHTHGEWVAMKDEGHYSGTFHYVGLTDGSESTVAMVYGSNSETTEANTKLIAAAPDLLKAVDGITRWIRQAAEVLELKANEDGKNSFLKPKLNWYADKIEAAIKKATE